MAQLWNIDDFMVPHAVYLRRIAACKYGSKTMGLVVNWNCSWM